MTTTIRSLLVLSLSLIFATTALAERVRLGHITPPSHVWHKVAERFDANLRAASDGKSSINIFPLARLGGDDQMIDLLQSGGLQLAILTAGSLSNRSESMNGWFLPFIFDDVASAAKAAQGPVAQEMLDQLEPHRLVGLGYTLAGMHHILATTPMQTAADFRNKKIRSFPSRLYSDFWGDLGAAPTALPISDVPSALTTNLLDALGGDMDIIVGLKMYQQAPHLVLTGHTAFPGVIVASQRWWNKLSPEQQTMYLEALREAEAWGYQEQIKAEISNLELLRTAGVEVHQVDRQDLQPIADKVIERYIARDPLTRKFYQSVTQ